MSETLILEKLEMIEHQYNKTEKKFDGLKDQYARTENKLDKIEEAVTVIAVQTERLNNISFQVHALQLKYDDAFGPLGVISVIKAHQAGCPKEPLKSSIERLWVVVGLISTVLTGCVLKVLGGF